MAEFLAPADWTQRADLNDLVAALGAGNARWVGGAVRDTLLHAQVNDVDCATPLHPDEVKKRLAAAGIRSVPTGIEHGTITALLAQGPVEITTLRRDVSTDGRRATVEFATRWEDDAARRDFTINALYADPETLEISDYFGGMADLAALRVRFIGDARQRIREDHLRILRYYRFTARFGSVLDDDAEEACAELAPMLKGLSRERVAAELLNLLALPDPSSTVERMFARAILPVVLPECGALQIATLRRLMECETSQSIAPDPIRRMAALLPADEKQVRQIAARLRLSNAQKKRLVKAAARDGDGAPPRAQAYWLGMEEALDRLLLQGKSTATLSDWTAPCLPLKGGEIVARGINAGPDIARLLQMVERQWVDEGFPDRARVEEILAALLRQQSGANGS